MVANVGAAVSLVVAGVESGSVQASWGRQFLFAALVVGVTMVMLRLLFRPAVVCFFERPALLVPVGAVVMATTLVSLVTRIPVLASILVPSWAINLFGLSLALSVGLVLQVLIWTSFATWQTSLLWSSVRGVPTDLDLMPPLRQHFLRCFGVLALGSTVLLVFVAFGIALTAIALPLAFLAMGAIGVLWNLLTAALLPWAGFVNEPYGQSLWEGFRESWAKKSQWLLQLVAVLMLFGLAILIRVDNSTARRSFDPRNRLARTQQNRRVNVKWQINAFWIGGYEHGNRWYGKYVEALEEPPIPLIERTLQLLFLFVAVCLKWTIVRALQDDRERLQAQSLEPPSSDSSP